jgi:aspartate aminotransferase
MATIQGQSTSNASSISQRAATVALNGDQACVADMNKAFKERHDFVVAGLNAIPGISCSPAPGRSTRSPTSQGAMRALGIKDDNAFAEYLLVEAGVAVVPGSGFGAPGSHAHLLRLQHGDARGRAAAHRARSPGSSRRA